MREDSQRLKEKLACRREANLKTGTGDPEESCGLRGCTRSDKGVKRAMKAAVPRGVQAATKRNDEAEEGGCGRKGEPICAPCVH